MAKHLIDSRFWIDPRIRSLQDTPRHLAMYLLTNERRTTEGLYRLPKALMSDDLGWAAAKVARAVAALQQAGFITYDNPSHTVLIVNALKQLPPAGEKQIAGAINRLAQLPPTPLMTPFYESAVQVAPAFAGQIRKHAARETAGAKLRHLAPYLPDTPTGYPTDTQPIGNRSPSARESSSSSSDSVSDSSSSSRAARDDDDSLRVEPPTAKPDAPTVVLDETITPAAAAAATSLRVQLCQRAGVGGGMRTREVTEHALGQAQRDYRGFAFSEAAAKLLAEHLALLTVRDVRAEIPRLQSLVRGVDDDALVVLEALETAVSRGADNVVAYAAQCLADAKAGAR